VLFSLDSLDNEQLPQSGMMAPSATGNTEASGLIDLAMLAGDSDNLDNMFTQGAPNAAPMGAPIKPMASLVTQPRNNRMGLIIAVVAILVAGLTGGIVWLLLKPQPNQQVPVVAQATPVAPTAKTPSPKVITKPVVASAKTAAPEATQVAAKSAAQGETSAQGSEADKAAAAKEKVVAKAAKSAAKPKTKRKSSVKRKSASKQKRRTKQAAKKPAPKPRPKPKRKAKASGDAAALLASLDGGGKKSTKRGGGLPTMDTPAVDPTLPERLDRGQVLRSIRRHFSKVKDCRRLEPDITGQVTVRFTVNGNGRVSGTKTTGQYANTPIGNCVAQKVRAIRFPRFSGSPFPINFPFSL
jgi:hypothetical protein